MPKIISTTLDCGATLLIEPIDAARTVALDISIPAGSATDPADGQGWSALQSEMIFRGAGGLSSREHSDALDRAGVVRSAQVGSHMLRLGATMTGDRIAEALPLISDLFLKPILDGDALEGVRSLCLQTLASLDDDPHHLVMLELRSKHVPAPFNRHGYGEPDVLSTATIKDLREAMQQRFIPSSTIIAAAGAINPADLESRFNALFEGWTGTCDEPVETAMPERGTHHLTQDTAQVHIAAAWDAPPESHPDSMLEHVAIRVLSGGSSCRLFTEVRQKRSLCYSVGASYSAGRDRGFLTLYAGTTPQRAQETLDVSLAEIDRLKAGATQDEFQRAVVGLKSQLVMQGESTQARAGALALDYFRLGRARSLDELAGAVDEVSLEQLNAYLARRSWGEMTTCTLGPQPLLASEVTVST